MNKVFVLFFILVAPHLLLAQSASSNSCSCTDLLNQLISKVESNYAGYVHKVLDKKDNSSYIQLKNNLIAEAILTSNKDCYDVLSKFLKYFNDGHLFIIEFPENTPQQSDSLQKLINSVTLTETQITKLKDQKNPELLEGIWQDKNQKVAIIQVSKNKFKGVTLENSNIRWTRGMVKMDIEKTGNNEYSITIFRNDFSPIRFTNIQIYKNCVLPFGVYRFVKESSNDPELKYVNTADPQMPVFQRIDAKNLLLTVPSALINSNILDSTLLAHEKEITSTENLILDVRSNLGGNSIWSSLIALANTKLYADPKNNNKDDFLLLASPDNAEYFNKMGSYFKQTKDSGGIAYYDNLARKIKENTGSIVGFSFYDPEIDTSRKKVYEFPKRVAIITDKGTASAGEAFVLSMKSNSTKVVVYGNNTYGMIDYMNVNTKKIPCQETSAYYYGYPTFFHPLSKRSL